MIWINWERFTTRIWGLTFNLYFYYVTIVFNK